MIKQSSWIDDPIYNVIKAPKSCNLKKAYDLLAAHPLAEIFLAQSNVEDHEMKSHSKAKFSVSPRILFDQINTKITSGELDRVVIRSQTTTVIFLSVIYNTN